MSRTMQSEIESITKPQSPPSPIHLKYLDGMRGLAAFYVVFGHILQLIVGKNRPLHLNPYLHKTIHLARAAHWAVDLFIVLSGYVLMVQLLNNKPIDSLATFKAYLKRRARRILPPYYAAIVFIIILSRLVPPMHHLSGSAWDMALPFYKLPLLLHLVMLHNFSANQAYHIDPPMWSVATEFQIYLLFPTFLLPVWRRFGGAAAIVAGYVAGLLLHTGLHIARIEDGACFWFVGLFAMGMCAADINSRYKTTAAIDTRWRPALAVMSTLVFGLAFTIPKIYSEKYVWASDILVGLTVMALIIVCTQHLQTGTSFPLLTIFSSKPVVRLGNMSYSLYLIHYPILAALQFGFWRIHLNDDAQLIGLCLLGVPLVLLVTSVFYNYCEKPYVSSARNKPSASAPVSPR